MPTPYTSPTSRLSRSWVSSLSPQPSNTGSKEFVLIHGLLEGEDRTARQQHLSEISEQLAGSKQAQTVFRDHAGIPAVIHVMATDLQDQGIQITAANLLSTLAEDEQTATEIGQREGVQALIDSLVHHQEDPTVCKAAIAALRMLTCVKENRATMLEYETLEHLISTMNTFIDDEALAEYIPATVANIVFGSNESRVKSGDLGAIDCFTKALIKHPSSTMVVAQCAFGIRNLIWECPPNLKRMDDQTIEIMLNLLSTHQGFLEAVTQLLGAFANMVSLDANIRTKLVTEKGFFVDLFHIMSAFVNESNLCATICFVLFTVGEHDMQHGWEHAQVIASHCKDTSSYSAIVSGLENAIRNKNDDAVTKFSHLIHVLSSSEDFRRDMGTCKALEAPIKALQEQIFSDELPISKLLCSIRSIISGNDEAKLQFKELNGFPITLEVMKAHMKSFKVMMKCTQVLDNAVDGQMETTEHLLDHKDEAISPLLAAMADFVDCAALQVNVCSIFVKIASVNPEEAAKLVRAGARQSVELAKSRHKGDPAVESLANQLLLLLVDNASGSRRGNARGSASSRLRSRSRTIQAGSRSRSRAGKSKSPDRMMKQARRALEAAKMKHGALEEGKGIHRANTAPTVRHTRQNTTHKLSLEPVFE